MEYFLSSIGIFFGMIALTLSSTESQRPLITKNIKTLWGTQTDLAGLKPASSSRPIGREGGASFLYQLQTVVKKYQFNPKSVCISPYNRSDEGLTLETSAFLSFTVANLRFQH